MHCAVTGTCDPGAVITILFTAGCMASANDFSKSSASGIEFGNYVLIEDEVNTVSAKSTNNKQQQTHKTKAVMFLKIVRYGINTRKK